MSAVTLEIAWVACCKSSLLPEAVFPGTGASLLFVGDSADGVRGTLGSDVTDMTLDTLSGDSAPPGVSAAEFAVGD